MNRERIAWLLSILLLTIAAFRSPGAAQRDSDYLFVRTLVDIHRQVLGNYVDPVDEKRLEQAAIEGMLNQLDPFTNYVPPSQRDQFERMLEGTFKGVGVQLNQLPDGNWEVLTPIDGSPAFRAGVMAGDLILAVNNEPVQGLRLQEVIKKIAGEAGTLVTLKVRHATGEEATLTMKREEIVLPTIKGLDRNPDNSWNFWVNDDPRIAYIRLTQFTSSTSDVLKGVLNDLLKQGMRGLILDLRWNPGGHLEQAVQVVDLFLEKGVIVKVAGRNRPQKVEYAKAEGTLPWFPIIVLVNEHSASAAEIVAGSLLDNHRAAVLGERTFGKGSVQEVMPLEGNNGELKLTVAYYYLPSGRLVHRKKDAETWGVEPQILVPMDDETEARVVRARDKNDLFHRPTTQPSTRRASSITPTTQPADIQLQRAVDTMILMTILQTNPQTAIGPATQPSGQ